MLPSELERRMTVMDEAELLAHFGLKNKDGPLYSRLAQELAVEVAQRYLAEHPDQIPDLPVAPP